MDSHTAPVTVQNSTNAGLSPTPEPESNKSDINSRAVTVNLLPLKTNQSITSTMLLPENDEEWKKLKDREYLSFYTEFDPDNRPQKLAIFYHRST